LGRIIRKRSEINADLKKTLQLGEIRECVPREERRVNDDDFKKLEKEVYDMNTVMVMDTSKKDCYN